MELLNYIMVEYADLAVAGYAGATVAAISYWRGWLQYLRHASVGVLCAVFASEPIYRMLVKTFLGSVIIETVEQERAAAFVAGGLGIFVVHVAIQKARKWTGLNS